MLGRDREDCCSNGAKDQMKEVATDGSFSSVPGKHVNTGNLSRKFVMRTLWAAPSYYR